MSRPKFNYKRPFQPEPLTTSTLSKIREKFANNGWRVIDTYDNSVFGKYCSMMEGLRSSQEQDLILELTGRFLKIELEEYDNYLFYSVNRLFKDIPNNTIHVAPMLAFEDIGKYKSAGMVSYRFKGDKVKTLPEYKKQKLVVHDSVQTLPGIDKEDIILLVDDFIGTGDTALKAIHYLFEIMNSNDISRIVVLSLVSLRTGLELLESMKIRIYSTVILEKGISDYYSQPEKATYLSLISDIENRMSVSNKYKLGYRKSEALVSMLRTPNNSFPIFWKDNGTISAPFPR